MHDPQTQAFNIKSPFKNRRGYRESLITIWHVDPENGPGGDDSCGWFKRAHHGDPAMLTRIEKSFEFDWDRTWTYDPSEDCEAEDGQEKRTYPCGFFNPSGVPRFSPIGIVLNLFFLAAGQYFDPTGNGRNWDKSRKWMQEHLFEIIHFAENPVDSLYDSLTLKYGNDSSREQRIHYFATIIYGYIMRAEQKWWQHPRWHVHHWRLQIHPLQNFKRWAFSRCCKCGKGFKWGGSVTTNSWNGTGPLWFRSEQNVYHDSCDLLGAEPLAQKENA